MRVWDQACCTGIVKKHSGQTDLEVGGESLATYLKAEAQSKAEATVRVRSSSQPNSMLTSLGSLGELLEMASLPCLHRPEAAAGDVAFCHLLQQISTPYGAAITSIHFLGGNSQGHPRTPYP